MTKMVSRGGERFPVDENGDWDWRNDKDRNPKLIRQFQFLSILMEEAERLLAEMMLHGFYHDDHIRHDATTWDINNGYCDTYAYAVEKRFPKAEAQWVIDPQGVMNDHCVLFYEGKHYDAECLDGVVSVSELPIYGINRNKSRSKSLTDRAL